MQNLNNTLHKADFSLDFTRVKTRKSEYNGLTDPNLRFFFSVPSRKKMLIKQRLVSYIKISPLGEINEKLCSKRITSKDYDLLGLRQLNLTPLSQRKKIRFLPNLSKKRNKSLITKRPTLRPITSEQFKALIHNHRAQVSIK